MNGRSTPPRVIRRGDRAYVPLGRGNRAIVDTADVNLVAGSIWRRIGAGYASRSVRKSQPDLVLRMHRVILGLSNDDDRFVDHINGNRLDNRRLNLRVCSNAENLRNRAGANRGNPSGYLGVNWCKRSEMWRARIRVDGRLVFVGRFATAEEAAEARDAAALLHHKNFAALNFPA